MSLPLFVTGIGTGVGKTLISTLLVRKWGVDYWKPIQAGEVQHPDRTFVRTFSGREDVRYFPETYFFKSPVSPHWAAQVEEIQVNPNELLDAPMSDKLLIEGAGGLMVPITPDFLMLDLIKQLKARVVLVSDHYLGSINHTLLTLQVLRNEGVSIAGLVFNHAPDAVSEQVILHHFPTPVIARVPAFSNITPAEVQRFVDNTDFGDI